MMQYHSDKIRKLHIKLLQKIKHSITVI